jgi:uncharacterized protein (DUF1778 family)
VYCHKKYTGGDMVERERRKLLTIRLNDEEREALERVAAHSGLGISDTMRQLIRSAAAQLGDKRSIVWRVSARKRRSD